VASAFCAGEPVPAAGATTLAYRARGVGELWHARTPKSDPLNALAVLLGPRRAELLFALRDPCTPTQLARTLQITQSAISQQLAQLTAAGVVRRLALGRNAYYQLTASGEAILRLFGSEPPSERLEDHGRPPHPHAVDLQKLGRFSPTG